MTGNADNKQKYINYKEQAIRLKKALRQGFYIEAIAIEYAIMEDRLESILRHEGVFNPNKHGSLARKLSRVKDLSRRKGSLERKYFSEEFFQAIDEWMKDRNALIHALLKQSLTTDEIQGVAEKGNELVRKLLSKATSIRRQLERMKENV